MIKQHVMELIERLEAGLKENAEETKVYRELVKLGSAGEHRDKSYEPYVKKLITLKEENHKLLALIEHLEDSIKDL